ncbi:hypothetical protein SMACR_01053 [Sordaria macrospora]|uniref:WGS project CABT00000000 data, contig 2.2 n=2 Tax=Sordaria macrospora TaxID=5147 RepID=F7VNV1_SORMK|nr:uncharacterized protein SMAC_01053 [Sordaria macrospora k-hell]KAA8632758.1 hypothetical protein SMACR_01053 [Sordaria macrospora]KAH7630573.1 hypothetical protein B0T09DRAFT_382510 [Sordaria sp. MPI-SDFR-AT-0083]WPJ62294.1 hypothetical protein SMAC4_01053 [Sordaria macrospora]CCC07030.1 unnamed protein product [Sordaria macrospora k-hell]
MAGIGITGVGNFRPYTFQALFLAIIEARQRFLRFAEENLSAPQGTLRRCPLAATIDRFLHAAVFWDTTSVPIQLQIEALDDEEVEDEEDEMYSTEDEDMENENKDMMDGDIMDEEEYEDMEE